MFIPENFLNKIKNGENIFYLLTIDSINKEINLTTNDKDVIINNKIYKSGFIVNTFNLANINVDSYITIALLSSIKKEISAEALSTANIVLKISTKDESFVIFSGFVSQLNIETNIINIDIISKMEKFNQTIGQLFSPICRECLGNAKCKVDIQNYSANGQVINILSQDCFVGDHQTNKKTATGYYKYGMIKFLTGKLAGITIQIKDEVENKIYLLRNTNLLNIGDLYIIFAGCDKTTTTCQQKFNNIENFRGEPFINKN